MVVLFRQWWSPRRILAGAIAAAALLAIVAGQVFGTSTVPIAWTATAAVSCTSMGAVILAGVPRHPVGRLLLAAGLIACVAVLGASWPGWLPLAWSNQWTWLPPFGLLAFALLVFPDGLLPSPRWRPLAVVLAGSTAVASVALAVAALHHPRTLITDPLAPMSDSSRLLVRVALAACVLSVGCAAGVLASLVVRWRRARGETRQQLACLLPAAVVVLAGVVLDMLNFPLGGVLTAVAVPVAMTVAILRYRLYDLDQVLNRTIVWLVMTVLVIVGFVAIVAVLRDALMSGNTSKASLVATGLIAAGFEPVRRRVQHGVDRLLYGDRDDPYKVIARMSDLLGRTVDVTATLPLLTDTIARSLQVPYVAVEIPGDDGPRRLAEVGRATTTLEGLDMIVHGERIGRLLVGTRAAGSRFGARERRLLADVALHAAVAVDATRLTRDLQESRERLVMAREEERRRLRRDLHDGLGPSLAGMSMQVRAARKLVDGTPRVGGILDALAADLRSCTADIRRLVDQLRPPVLDNGLAAALRSACQRFNDSALRVDLHVDGRLAGLPAAIEVAAYRIVAEALTNVARHAAARVCRVEVSLNTALRIEVTDDGVGVDAATCHGVGLTSMRERAAELGGTCVIEPAAPRGTAVRVHLPLQLRTEDQPRTEEPTDATTPSDTDPLVAQRGDSL